MPPGTIVETDDFGKARKPAHKLKIDFGELSFKQSSAQITQQYSKEQLIGGRQLQSKDFPKI